MTTSMINLIKIGNSKGFCIPAKILKELGPAETFIIHLIKETKTLEIKPSERLMDKWVRDFSERGNDGVFENKPIIFLNETLREDLQFQPDFDVEEKCSKRSKPLNRDKSSK